jgi:hypothetical protein
MLAIGRGICVLLMRALPLLITRPMKRMVAHVEDIADGDGNLTVRLEGLIEVSVRAARCLARHNEAE